MTSGGVVGVYEYTQVESGASIPPERFALPEELFEALSSQSSKRALTRRFFQVQMREAQPVASILAKVPAVQVARTAAEALPEIMGYLTEIGAHTEGGPFCLYHTEDDRGVDIEIGKAWRPSPRRASFPDAPAGE